MLRLINAAWLTALNEASEKSIATSIFFIKIFL
jgi:hypothetical protein